AANAVIAQAREGFSKTLTSSKLSAELPHLVTVEDEMAQAVYVADQVLEHREAGIDLRHQAVLFRTSHHSGRLEIELAGRNTRSSNIAGSNLLRRHTSRTCWQSCAGRKTRG